MGEGGRSRAPKVERILLHPFSYLRSPSEAIFLRRSCLTRDSFSSVCSSSRLTQVYKLRESLFQYSTKQRQHLLDILKSFFVRKSSEYECRITYLIENRYAEDFLLYCIKQKLANFPTEKLFGPEKFPAYQNCP